MVLALCKPHENWAKFYDYVYKQAFGNVYLQITEKNKTWILENLKAGSRILDIGAGTGRLSIPLAESEYLVSAVEPCREMLDILLEKARVKNLNITPYHCSLAEYAGEGDHDLAVCVFTTMNYILAEEEMRRSIQKLVNAVKSGGKILFDLAMLDAMRSYNRPIPGGRRKVNIESLGDNLYNYVEDTNGNMNGEPFSYHDDFKIRYWEARDIQAFFSERGLLCQQIAEQIPFHRTFLVIK